jgi:RNase P protein component
MNFIPDVFVIGAMKSGTTTLYNSVLRHSAISLTNMKEVNYFLKDLPLVKLNELYKVQFSKPELLKIDVSPNYAKRHLYPDVARKIHQANPKAKIIFIVRDPYHRLLSHLHHNLLRDRFKEENLENEVLTNRDYILTSSYGYQLEEYFKLFGEKNVLVLVFENLRKSPQHFVEQLQTFLEIENIRLSNGAHYSSESRYKIKFYDPVHNVLGRSKLAKLYNYFWYFLNIKVKRPTLSEAVKRELIRRLQTDLSTLKASNKIDTSGWRNFSNPSS